MTDPAAAKYIDAKADAARAQGKRGDAEIWNHHARLLENIADELRIGFHLGEVA